MAMMAIPTVPERASSLATAATRADAAIPEQHPAPRWPVLPLRMLPRNLEPASSTALSMPKERRTLLMMAVILVLAPVAILPTPVPWQLVSHAPPARMVVRSIAPVLPTWHRMGATVALAERMALAHAR